jgi:ribosomal protein S20
MFLAPFLEWQAQATASPALGRATRDLVDSLIELRWYDDALRCLDRLVRDGDRDVALVVRRSFALVKIGEPDEALAELATVEKEIDSTVESRLFGQKQLVKMLAYYYKSEFAASFQIYRQLNELEAELDPVAALYVKRSAIMFFECDSTPKPLAEAAQGFEMIGAHFSAARTRSALAAELAKSGAFAAARSTLATAEAALSEVATERLILLNNAQAIDLLDAAPTVDGAKTLSSLLLQTFDAYGRITLLNNAMLAWALLEQRERALEYAEDLASFCRRGATIDAQNFWTSARNLNFVTQHFDVETDLKDVAVPLGELGDIPRHWILNALARGDPAPSDALKTLFSRPYRPVFLYDWGFEMRDFLNAPREPRTLAQ